MCVLDPNQADPHLDEARSSEFEDQGDDHQLKYSLNGGGVGAVMEVPAVGYFSSGSAPAFCAQQLPLLRWSEFDLSDGTAMRRCYAQIMDITTL